MVNPIQNRLEKLIEAGKEMRWEECSYAKPEHNSVYGRATPAWNTWASRIENILKETVKPGTEPFIYFNAAKSTAIDGNYKDKFDFAKENYVKALTTLKSLLDDGDIFGDLLTSNVPTPTPRPQKKINDDALSQSNKKVFIVHGHDHALKIELEVFLSHIGLKPVVLPTSPRFSVARGFRVRS
jgi:hypothetical protein